MATVSEVPENLLASTARREWSGALVEVTEYNCNGEVLHQLPHSDKTRLSVIVEEVSKYRCEPRENRLLKCPHESRPRDMTFMPAGIEIWGYSADVLYAKDVHITLDLKPFAEQLHIKPDADLATVPKLRFTDDRIWYLVRLLADVIEDPDPSVQLYGDSLITAIASRLLSCASASSKRSVGLSNMQLKDAMSFLDAHMPNRVELPTLARLAGMSPSHYCRAFKAATGFAPYQWQLNARIERAKCMLLETNFSLDHIAEATGFADSVHFGRTFRKLTQASPGAWRLDRQS
jgi:AraC family transcriptional regulator